MSKEAAKSTESQSYAYNTGFFAVMLYGLNIKMVDSDQPVVDLGDRARLLEEMGVDFEFSGTPLSGILTIKASNCADLVLNLGKKEREYGFYLPFEGLVAPKTKWLRSVEMAEKGNVFKLRFGDHPKNNNGKETLTYIYKKSFSMYYTASG